MIKELHHNKFLGRIFHTLDYCLQRELKDCVTVLDLGCGPSSPLQYCSNIKRSIGVETFVPYLEQSKQQKIHTEYLEKRIEDLDFPADSFDAVILIEVLEHLIPEVGADILAKAQKWAKKKVVVSTPNGYFPMDSVDQNEFQRHLSGWTVKQMKQLSFKVYGVSGAKFFYLPKNTIHSLTNQADNFCANIRFRPKKFFYLFNGLLQIFTYYLPQSSFGLFLVKSKKYDL